MIVPLLAMLLTSCSTMDVRVDEKLCGLNSLYVAMRFLDRDRRLDDIDLVLRPEKAPFSIAELDAAARRYGFTTSARHYPDKNLVSFENPAIAHVRIKDSSKSPDHFLACLGETEEGILVAEIPQMPFFLPRDKFLDQWDGDILFVKRVIPRFDFRSFELRSSWRFAWFSVPLLAIFFVSYHAIQWSKAK